MELFASKGRFDEAKGEIREAWKLKIFRQAAKGEKHTDFIANNKIYTQDENNQLNDYVADEIAS